MTSSENNGSIHLKLSKAGLFEALQAATRIASSRTSIQALAGVQISADASGIELRATDMELSLRLPLEGKVEKPGEIVLPARLFADVVRSLPSGEVDLKARPDKQDVELSSGSATFDIRTLRAEDFPTLPTGGGAKSVSLPAAALAETIKRVERAASTDQARPVLTGILVQAEATTLRMVATDSYRLAIKETPLAEALPESFEANVPARALQEAVRLAQGTEGGTVQISVEENQIVFTINTAVLASRLIDGQFPKYADLLPDAFEHELKISIDELLDVVRRVSLMAQGNKPLRLSFEKGTLTISSETQDVGEARESLPVPFDGEGFEIGFNPAFLRDGIESTEEGDLIFKLINAVRPGLIESSDGSGFQYLIMPIRLGT
jgi:DNA polymerase-3 subunit beta